MPVSPVGFRVPSTLAGKEVELDGGKSFANSLISVFLSDGRVGGPSLINSRGRGWWGGE